MFELINLTKKKTPALVWTKIKEKIIGHQYNLDVVLAGEALMKKLNKTHRNQNKTADTLSFPLSKQDGEIFLNINNPKEKQRLLFIHSLLHLKGLRHGTLMEKKEKMYYNYFYGKRTHNDN